MQSILFDLDGVFYQGEHAIEGAANVVAWARDRAIPHLFLTNTTSRPRSALVDKLAGFGIDTTIKHIFTPAVATVQWLQQYYPDQKVALFIPQTTKSEFQSILQSDTLDASVAAVVVGDLGEQWDFKTLETALETGVTKLGSGLELHETGVRS